MYVAAPEPTTGTNVVVNGGSIPGSLSAWFDSASEARIALNDVLEKALTPAELPAASTISRALPAWLKRSEWKRLPYSHRSPRSSPRRIPVSIARMTSCFSSGVLPRSHAASRRSSSPSSRRRLRPWGTVGRRTIFTGFRGSHSVAGTEWPSALAVLRLKRNMSAET
jgi:hypothetical protein